MFLIERVPSHKSIKITELLSSSVTLNLEAYENTRGQEFTVLTQLAFKSNQLFGSLS